MTEVPLLLPVGPSDHTWVCVNEVTTVGPLAGVGGGRTGLTQTTSRVNRG